MLNRSKTYAAGLLVVTFLLGVGAGGAAFGTWRRPERRPPQERRERVSYPDRLQQELGLSVAQRESVEVILSRGNGSMREMWRDMQPRFDTLRLRINQEIVGQLDEEQRQLFEQLMARGDSARRSRERRGTHER